MAGRVAIPTAPRVSHEEILENQCPGIFDM